MELVALECLKIPIDLYSKRILFILADNNDVHEDSEEFEIGQIGPPTMELAALECLKKSP